MTLLAYRFRSFSQGKKTASPALPDCFIGGRAQRATACAGADRPFKFDGRFDYGRIVHWKAGRPKRILGTCPNRVIDPVNAARFMTAASTLQRLARSAALNASCAARPSRIGTPPGCLDIGSSPVQLRNPNDSLPNAVGTPARSQRFADEPNCLKFLDSPAAFLESWRGYPPGKSSSKGSNAPGGRPCATWRRISTISSAAAARA